MIAKLISICILSLFIGKVAEGTPCISKDFGLTSFVCVCNRYSVTIFYVEHVFTCKNMFADSIALIVMNMNPFMKAWKRVQSWW